jgi:hypothetical protein
MGLASLSDLPPIEEFMPTIDLANQFVDELALRSGDYVEEL